jgi:hypothetical protein
MPRIIVTTDGQDRRVLLEERVVPEHFDSEHYAHRLVERVGWAVSDAADSENPQPRRR